MKSPSAWVVILFFVISLSAQRVTFHAVTRLVQVPVEVFNSHGKFVPGLVKADFQLRINGKLWPIANLDMIHSNAPATPSNHHFIRQWRRGIFSNHIQESPHNRIVFLFDMTHIPKLARMQIQQKINRILRKPVPGNEDIAILEENPGLIVLQSFTQNRQNLQKAIDQIGYYHSLKTLAYAFRALGGLYGGNLGGDAVALNQSSQLPSFDSYYNNDITQGVTKLTQYMGQVVSIQQYYGTIDTLNMVSRMLANIPGHKEIIWFTNDTDYTAPGNPNLILSGQRLRKLIRTLNNANISLFPIDPGGLATFAGSENPGLPHPILPGGALLNSGVDPNRLITHNLASAGASTFANRTGGRAYSDYNSIAKILTNTQRYWNAGYVLYFHPPQPSSRQRRYYNIQVKVLRSGIHAMFRRGFYVRQASYRPKLLNRQALKKIAMAPMDWHGLPMTIHLGLMGPAMKQNWKTRHKNQKIRHEPFKIRLPMKLLLHHLPNHQYGYDFTAQIFTINSQTGAVAFSIPNHFHNILSAQQAAALRGQVNYYRSYFIVDNGIFYLGRVILRDNYSHQIGSVTVPLNGLVVSKTHH